MGMNNNIEKVLLEQAKRTRSALNATFELLPVCNLDCKMCYIRTDMEMVRENGGLLPVEKWLNLAKEMRKAGVLFLLLTGGEVFLYPEFRTLYERLIRMGFVLTINTNATMISEEMVAWLSQYRPRCVSISLYGASNQTYKALCGQKGMFDRVDWAIRALRQANITVECKMLVNPLNENDMEACVDYCNALDIPFEMANYTFPPTRKLKTGEQIRFTPAQAVECGFKINQLMTASENQNEVILERLVKYRKGREISGCQQYGFSCTAANSACWITWQGRMTPCAMLNEPYTLPFKIGFEAAWNELKLKSDQVKLCTECSFCDKRSVCNVCPASCYAETGFIDGQSKYHCEMTKLQIEKMMKYAEEHYLNWEE